jgi:hypothetical protein
MDTQTRDGYMVDNRYHGVKKAIDSPAQRDFLSRFIERHKQAQGTNLTEDRKEDDRFVVSGPGNNMYTFKNAYGSERSPEQRRLGRLNQ